MVDFDCLYWSRLFISILVSFLNLGVFFSGVGSGIRGGQVWGPEVLCPCHWFLGKMSVVRLPQNHIDHQTGHEILRLKDPPFQIHSDEILYLHHPS